MSYQALARKWRPRTFSTLVGQAHVVKALTNALDNDRVHHAFLFTGTRGVGKTTIARIFAKALNCLQGVGSSPCGACQACVAIDEGRFVDLLEVDAASRTKVEDTRELLENVQYTPTMGRYKVYLVDEVHMLSTSSFNALLKTLEEPPPHVKFLLATTDPQKLPVTVLSRCLQFSLKRLPVEMIAEHLGRLLAQERIEFEPAALPQLAHAADGSMRDALSLLDQAIAFGGGTVRLQDVQHMLGVLDRGHVVALLDALAADDGAAVLAAVARLSEDAPDFAAVLADILTLLQQMAVAQAVPEAVQPHWASHEAVVRLSGLLTPETVQLFYQIALNGRRDLKDAPEPRGGFEMVLLRMLAFRPVAAAEAGAARSESDTVKKNADQRTLAPTESTAAADVAEAPATEVVATKVTAAAQAHAAPPPDWRADNWPAIVARLDLSPLVRELASNAHCTALQDDVATLELASASAQLRSGAREADLRQALSALRGGPVTVRFQETAATGETPAQHWQRETQDRLAVAQASIEADPAVQGFIRELGGRILADSVTLVGACRPGDVGGASPGGFSPNNNT